MIFFLYFILFSHFPYNFIHLVFIERFISSKPQHFHDVIQFHLFEFLFKQNKSRSYSTILIFPIFYCLQTMIVTAPFSNLETTTKHSKAERGKNKLRTKQNNNKERRGKYHVNYPKKKENITLAEKRLKKHFSQPPRN